MGLFVERKRVLMFLNKPVLFALPAVGEIDHLANTVAVEPGACIAIAQQISIPEGGRQRQNRAMMIWIAGFGVAGQSPFDKC